MSAHFHENFNPWTSDLDPWGMQVDPPPGLDQYSGKSGNTSDRMFIRNSEKPRSGSVEDITMMQNHPHPQEAPSNGSIEDINMAQTVTHPYSAHSFAAPSTNQQSGLMTYPSPTDKQNNSLVEDIVTANGSPGPVSISPAIISAKGKQKLTHVEVTNPSKRRTLPTPTRAQVEELKEVNRNLVTKRKVDKAHISMLKEQLHQAELQLAQNQLVKLPVEQDTSDVDSEMEVEHELAQIDTLKSQIADFRRIGQLTELNRQTSEITRLLAYITKLQTLGAAPSAPTNFSTQTPPLGPSVSSSASSSSAPAEPSPTTTLSQSSAIPPQTLTMLPQPFSIPPQSTTNQIPQLAAPSFVPSSVVPPPVPAPSFPFPSAPVASHPIKILKPGSIPSFITADARKERNARQDNVAAPRRTVQRTSLPFHVTSSSQKDSNSPRTHIDELIAQMNGAAEHINFSNQEHSRVVVELMRKLLHKMGHADIWPQIEAKGKSNRSRTKPGSPADLSQEKRQTRERIGTAEHHQWEDAIREIWKNFYDVSCANDFMNYQAADPEEVNDFEEGIGTGPDKNLPLALHTGGKNSRWNRVITSRLVASITETRRADSQKWNLCDVTEKYILALIMNQVTEAQRAYLLAEQKIIDQEGKPRRETEEEVKARIQEYYHGSTDNPGRLRKKHERRISTASECAKEGGEDAETWRRIAAAYERLGVGGESDEEKSFATMNGLTVEIFEVLKVPWRAEVFDMFSAVLDRAHARQRNAQSGRRGLTSLTRSRTDKESTRSPPEGLPRSFFSPRWLEKQNEYTLEKLKISAEQFPLDFEDSL